MAETTETKSLLTKQAERMREELAKAADKVKEIPAVKKALDAYDEQMEKLRQAMVRDQFEYLFQKTQIWHTNHIHNKQDSDAAKKIFELLTKAKEALIKAIEAAQNSPLGQSVMAKVSEAQAQGKSILWIMSVCRWLTNAHIAQAKIEELKAKAGVSKPAAAGQ